ncbi:MAG: diguanylate cyclase [Sporomusaceae bacterium]|nr:diguanylate cyclase [Sporomusaceae bacterium]
MKTWFGEAGLRAVLEIAADMAARLDCNGVFRELYRRPGYQPQPPDRRAPGAAIEAAYEPPLAARCRQALEKLLRTGQPQRFYYEGDYGGKPYGREFGLTVCGEDPLLLERDTANLTLTAVQLRQLNRYDALTGLFNRRCFEQELRYRSAASGAAGVIVCALNGLRLINNSLGRKAGDTYLQAVAEILKRSLGVDDHIARIDGGEFAVILAAADVEATAAACRQIDRGIAEYNRLLPGVRLALAVGQASGAAASLELLFSEAENMMYRQKQQRGGSEPVILDGLLRSAQERDYGDDGHPQRVEEYALKLAAALQLTPQQRENIRLLARYHDIGAAGLDERLLLKPGKLTAEEREKIKKHCEIGWRIASCVPALSAIADLILRHHEQWDGGGYPLGIRCGDIPVECRVLAIADAYEVMTAGRPYRRPISPEQAAAELRRGAGRQFDPELVGRFLPLLDSGTFQGG